MTVPNMSGEVEIYFKGTKSRGWDWERFAKKLKIKSSDDVYGKAFTIQEDVIWLYIYNKETHKLLDTSTWGFLKEDLK